MPNQHLLQLRIPYRAVSLGLILTSAAQYPKVGLGLSRSLNVPTQCRPQHFLYLRPDPQAHGSFNRHLTALSAFEDPDCGASFPMSIRATSRVEESEYPRVESSAALRRRSQSLVSALVFFRGFGGLDCDGGCICSMLAIFCVRSKHTRKSK